MIGFLGIKLDMTQIFNDQGLAIPITVIKVGECFITQIKKHNTDGYNSVQIGHLKKANIFDKNIKIFREFRLESNNIKSLELGEKIPLSFLQVGDKLNVIGYSIGKGFAGYQKRHNFSRGPMSHGSKNHRLPGSIGAGTTPGRVYPGKKMAGHLGNRKTTIKNLEIVLIDIEKNVIGVKGSVPGKTGNLISIYK
ncbi:[pt] large subunit ribosomal protein L3 [Galdieria sulphuraria]|uniref:Large ribosomal subunit protein uL3c n=1 Tax=Galdieria sulphuraria TaxID=130081 RepID=M2XYF5_GALSU|nr:[pt] large subunit ribosomal protein L3 [Galdieria sulphuraria]EME28494.1 [pt] large subunit ribosomal protein L3 [Galdieria sulphuraria]|eukprot:XP_005705014.1 [pt] large subunit ribosomal protein L3 [Galdieria sulphuraria]